MGVELVAKCGIMYGECMLWAALACFIMERFG